MRRFPCDIRRPALALAVSMLALPMRAGAGEPGLRSATTRPGSFPEQSVLLLKNGRLVRGRISWNSGGYVVDLPNGRMVVPVSQVRFQETSADAVYRRLKKQTPLQSPRHRLALAGWCTTNELYSQAIREVRAVLKANPDDESAKRMLRRINAIVNRDKDDDSKRKSIYDRIVAPEVTALAGLSPTVARNFVAKVQPILMNGCAQSRCHGPNATGSFRLSLVHLGSGGRRGLSEKNLATTLRFIDLKSPDSSPLLTKPLGNHGRRGRSIFRGRAGTKQLNVLRSWVREIASGTSNSTSASSASTKSSTRKGTPAGYQLTPAMQAAHARRQGLPASAAPRNSRIKSRQKPGDPFDPAEFNRQSTGSNPRSRSRTRRRRIR